MKIHYSEFGHNIISCNINIDLWPNSDDLSKVTCVNCLKIELKWLLRVQKELRLEADENMSKIGIIQMKLKNNIL